MSNDIFEYFLRNFRLYYDMDNISIGYGNLENARITIVKHAEDDFWDKKSDVDPQNVVWKKWNGIDIPFLFDRDGSSEIITNIDGKVSVNYDIVASAFYFLSGWNEFVNPCNDEYGRIDYEQSMVKKLGVAHIPVVNYYFDILHCAISQSNEKTIKRLWHEHSFAVALTHDIDNCMSAWLEGSFSELKKGRILSIPRLVLKRLMSHDDWFNFDLIASIEKQYNARSTFFFLPEKDKKGKWKNADYQIDAPKIKQAIQKLEDAGFEIGIHGSFGTHVDTQKLTNEIQKIKNLKIESNQKSKIKNQKSKIKNESNQKSKIKNQKLLGTRFHFLMFDPTKTPGILEKSGVQYDTTLGFAEHTGFRRGTCYPFYLYDFEQNKSSTVLEIPLTVMDTTLRSQKFTPEKTRNEIIKLVDEVKKFNGVFTLLWHNNYFSEYKFTGWKQIYIDIMEYCSNNNALMTSCCDLYEKIKK